MKTKQLFSLVVFTCAGLLLVSSCKKDKDTTPSNPAATPAQPSLVFKFKFDSTQVRLDNFGNPSTVASGNAAQSPKFNVMSQHYIELAGDFDALGAGQVLYNGATTTAGGASAIDYGQASQSAQGQVFFSKPLSQITPGSYKWLRVSLAYQNYNITYKSSYIPGSGLGTGTLASFIGFRTYLTSYKINGHTYVPTSSAGGPGNHDQGYWGFETNIAGTNYFVDGQAPAGATTVPNPLFATSPIPAGSCVVTGQFLDHTSANSPLVITGNETSDIVITVSLSTNKSFEWHEVTADGYFQPEIGETVVDMGVRGMMPIKN